MMGAVADEFEHPAFPQPVNANAIIWRYMDFDKFKLLVETGRLYMRRADLFLGDEFEGTTPAGEIKYWRLLAENAGTFEERATIEHNRAELAEYAAHFRANYFVSCWNMAESENVAMWERYTTVTESVSIVSRYSMLRAQFDRAVVNLGVVRYIDYETTALPSLNMLQRISHKRHFFRDENEVRAVMTAIAPEQVYAEFIAPHMTADGCGWAPPVNVQALVEAVVLHPKATPEFAQQASEFCAARQLPIPSPSKMGGPPRF